MRFKTDENLPDDAADLLNAAGHDAMTVLDENLGGFSYEKIAAVCQREGRVLITLDSDFADIRMYPPQEYPGIVVLRIKKQDKERILDVLNRLHPIFDREEISGKLWIVEEERVRVRG